MKTLFNVSSLVLVLVTLTVSHVYAQDKNLVVRVAKLKIDSLKLQEYNAALKEEIETSVHIEPGVLTLYAVAEKDNPTSITIFEIYINADAFKSHLESTHFKKYKSTTQQMVLTLELIETEPIILAIKPNVKKKLK
ncbi:MAG: antibiotic biosynthesis monooxygenase [Flammeovirgaceae bacterium]|nr:antibiotic biosynthesis monooxygenase [Flammeovirgaceae bacterium]